jgi:hypothetical protein
MMRVAFEQTVTCSVRLKSAQAEDQVFEFSHKIARESTFPANMGGYVQYFLPRLHVSRKSLLRL